MLDKDRRSALHFAAFHGKVHVAGILLQHGADIKAKDELGFTALHSAASGGYQEMAALLVNKGLPIDIPDDDNNSPLYIAIINGNILCASMLIKLGANLDHSNQEGKTPRDAAKESHKAKDLIWKNGVVMPMSPRGQPIVDTSQTSQQTSRNHLVEALPPAAQSNPNIVRFVEVCV